MELNCCGTPMYMAPEMLALKESDGTAMLDPWKADIYSLGLSMLKIMFPQINSRKKLLKRVE